MSTAEVTDFARLKTIFHEATDSDVDIKEVTENSQDDDSCMGQIATILTNERHGGSPQVPRLPLPANKSLDSSKSLNTVVHHDSTPTSQDVAFQPHSTNLRSPSSQTQSTRDEVDEIASLTSQEALKSLYSLLSSKLSSMQDNPLSPKDRQDIQAFFQTQKKGFRQSLRSNLGSRPLVVPI
jgi:U3 small nucleolar RNA-associated protein 14